MTGYFIKTKQVLSKTSEMKDPGEVYFVLGIEIYKDYLMACWDGLKSIYLLCVQNV